MQEREECDIFTALRDVIPKTATTQSSTEKAASMLNMHKQSVSIPQGQETDLKVINRSSVPRNQLPQLF